MRKHHQVKQILRERAKCQIDVVRSLPLPYNPSGAVHRGKIESHQMANLVTRKIHIPATSTIRSRIQTTQ